MSAPDVIVIGGGIVGTAATAFLSAGGASVTLYERSGLASGASGANSGVIQHPFDPPLVALYEETVELYRGLSAAGVGFQLPAQPAGLLFVSRERAVVGRLAASVVASFPELHADVLEGADLQALEPALAPDLVACRVAMAYPVPPSASTYAFATLAERRGAVIRLGRPAVPVIRNARVVGVRVDGRVTSAGTVLIAAGPSTPELVDPTGVWRPIRSLWGVVVETELAAPPRHVLEEAEIEAAIGRAEPVEATQGRPASEADIDTGAASFSLVSAGGVSALGSTFLEREPNAASWIVPLLVRGSSFVPGLATAPIRSVRVCARPQASDGRPLIGAVPGIAGLFVCAGHGPWGISTGPASARLVSDVMLGLDPQVPQELETARFGPPPSDH